MKYIYTAVFTEDNDGKVYARVPDLDGCITTGKSLEDAIEMITDAMSLWLVTAEDDGSEIRPATKQADIIIQPGEEYSLIYADTLKYRAQYDTRSVRKNVSLPQWMVKLAEKKGINCSKVLQDALMDVLA